MADIAIIGAGVAGLSAAYDLAGSGHKVTVYEVGDKVGGLAAGFKDPDWDWTLEKFYHHWFASDKDLLALAEELKVTHKILFPRPKTSIWDNGSIYQLDSAKSALLLPTVPITARLRFGAVMAFLRFTRQWRRLEKYTAHGWLEKYMGKTVYNKIWKPLLIGKFGKFYQEVNMAWFWARVYSRTPRLGTFRGGFQAFMEVLANAASKRGATIYLHTGIGGIRKEENGKISLQIIDGDKVEYDKVLSTTSPHLLRKLAPQINGEYAEKLENLRHTGAVVVIVALKEQMLEDGTYWLNLPANSPDKSENEFPYVAFVEHTNYMKPGYYGGNHLVYMGDYVPPDHEYFQMDVDELAGRFMATLPKFNPKFQEDWIIKHWVVRAPYAQPLPTLNHSENIPDIKTPVDGLYWASMSQVYPWDRGTNYAVEIGRRAAKLMMESQ